MLCTLFRFDTVVSCDLDPGRHGSTFGVVTGVRKSPALLAHPSRNTPDISDTSRNPSGRYSHTEGRPVPTAGS